MNEHTKTHDFLEQSDQTDGVDWSRLVFGLALVALGLFLGLERLDLVDTTRLWRWLPAVLVVMGLLGLFRGADAKARDGSWWLLISGTYLLINFFEVLGFGWHNSWPLLLVMAGGAYLIDPETAADRTNAYWLLALGIVFLVVQGEVLGLAYGDLWPVLIIAVGVVMTWRALTSDDQRRDGRRGAAK